jgi:CubicO group peptidase (beta-lactamase class C family)
MVNVSGWTIRTRRSARSAQHLCAAVTCAAVALACSGCSSGSGTPSASSTQSTPDIDLHALVVSVQTQTGVPGIAAAVARSDGAPTVAVAGVRNVDSGVTIQPADVFEIGSLTKSVTATALAALIDHGRLKWDNQIADGPGSGDCKRVIPARCRKSVDSDT